jgi:hypothetical protein
MDNDDLDALRRMFEKVIASDSLNSSPPLAIGRLH